VAISDVRTTGAGEAEVNARVLRPVPAGAAARTTQPPSVWRRIHGDSRATTVQHALVAVDAAAVLTASTPAIWLASAGAHPSAQSLWTLAYLPAVLVLFKLYGLYDGDRRRLGHSTVDDVPGLFHAALLATLGLWAWLKLAPAGRLVFLQAALFLVLTVGTVLLARAGARRLLSRHVVRERVLLVGGGPSAELLVRKMEAYPRLGLQPVGYLRDGLPGAATNGQMPCLGTLEQLPAVCQDHAVDRVLVAAPTIDTKLLTDLVREANRAGMGVTLLPSAVDVLGSSTEVDDLGGVTVLSVNPPHLSRSSWLLKRALDVSLSAVALLVILPFLPLVAAAIRIDSPGPVFFSQERLGRGGRRFRLFKLRTMVPDAEARVAQLQTQSAHPAWLLLDRDPRVTRVGRFLRRSSIDELPQLWNVLRGEMSLVGPRPMPPATDLHILGWGRRRLDLTPGITGMWQVLGRTSVPFDEMIKLDYLYVTNWSVWGDIRLLLRTVSVVISRQGAN
jgi:exopolysaccharide biosynthesis polyprenyl glycosylphosphotransferase